jgi:hypothetical protein
VGYGLWFGGWERELVFFVFYHFLLVVDYVVGKRDSRRDGILEIFRRGIEMGTGWVWIYICSGWGCQRKLMKSKGEGSQVLAFVVD